MRGSRTRGYPRASVRARGAIDRGVHRQTLATSASRGERPRAVVIVAENLTGSTEAGTEGEDALSRDEGPLRGVRGGSGTVGSAESRPRRGEHTTHLSRLSKTRTERQGERERERNERRRMRRASEVCRGILPPAVDITAGSSSASRIHTRNHERAVSSVRSSGNVTASSGRTRARSPPSLHQLHGVGGSQFSRLECGETRERARERERAPSVSSASYRAPRISFGPRSERSTVRAKNGRRARHW